jgi:sugar/nucleoside kinase (ribokinase family)
VPGLAVIGNTSRDIIAGAPPRVGGPPFHAGRALRELGTRARIVTRCAADDRRLLLQRVIALGLPVTWAAAERTAAFSFSYEGDVRRMVVDELADPWTPADARGWAGRGLGGADWVLVGGLVRSDFPPATLAELARGRRLLLDGQGLARPGRTGPLEIDGDVDPDVYRAATVLKVSEREATALAGSVEPDAIRALGVPEVLVTFGSGGSLVVTRMLAERIQVRPIVGRDPTGSGDALAAAYLEARATGHSPASAARRAAALVSALLLGRVR